VKELLMAATGGGASLSMVIDGDWLVIMNGSVNGELTLMTDRW